MIPEHGHIHISIGALLIILMMLGAVMFACFKGCQAVLRYKTAKLKLAEAITNVQPVNTPFCEAVKKMESAPRYSSTTTTRRPAGPLGDGLDAWGNSSPYQCVRSQPYRPSRSDDSYTHAPQPVLAGYAHDSGLSALTGGLAGFALGEALSDRGGRETVTNNYEGRPAYFDDTPMSSPFAGSGIDADTGSSSASSDTGSSGVDFSWGSSDSSSSYSDSGSSSSFDSSPSDGGISFDW